METLNLTPEAVAMYRDFLENPAKHNQSYKPITEVMVKSDKVTAQHVLYKNYLEYLENRPLPKVIFYIIIQQIFGMPNGKDETGMAGYYLTVTP